jgi:hypothetical protein
MPTPATDWSGEADPYEAYAATSLTHIKNTGGWDAHAIMYGDWSWYISIHPSNQGYTDAYAYRGKELLCNYAYRGMPVITDFAYPTWGSGSLQTLANLHTAVYIGRTNPNVTAEVGCPAFKTQKILGGRALVSDAFERTWGETGYWQGPMHPGVGVLAHRDGYNVLYGDWSAKWYGDPQQRLIWWPEFYWAMYTGGVAMWNVDGTSSALYSYDWRVPGGADDLGWGTVYYNDFTRPGTYDTNDGACVWHLLDVSAGMDAVGNWGN